MHRINFHTRRIPMDMFFQPPFFEAILLFHLKSHFSKSHFSGIDLAIYCITRKWHTHRNVRNIQHIITDVINVTIFNDFMRVELSYFPSENMKKNTNIRVGSFSAILLFLQKTVCCFFRNTPLKK